MRGDNGKTDFAQMIYEEKAALLYAAKTVFYESGIQLDGLHNDVT